MLPRFLFILCVTKKKILDVRLPSHGPTMTPLWPFSPPSLLLFPSSLYSYIIPIYFCCHFFVTSFYLIKVMEEDMFCYIHEGGQLVKCVGGSVQYQGGRSESMVVSRHMSHSDFVSKLCDALHFDQNSIKLEFTVKFEPSCLLPLHDDAALLKMFRFNEMFCHVYVSSSSEVVEGCIAPTRY